MGTRPITEEFVREVAADLQARYALDGDDVRVLGERLAEHDDAERREANRAFAERFVAEHRETFDRLAE